MVHYIPQTSQYYSDFKMVSTKTKKIEFLLHSLKSTKKLHIKLVNYTVIISHMRKAEIILLK